MDFFKSLSKMLTKLNVKSAFSLSLIIIIAKAWVY